MTLTDKDTGEPLADGVFTLYKDGVAIETGLTTDANGQIVIEGLTTGEYYFEETEAPDGYDLPSNAVSDTVNVASSLTKAESYDLTMTNAETVVAVKYAVKLWGICADTYSYDDGATTGTASLTFGPATGANHLSNYVECDSDTCIHKLSWDEIIAYCNQYQGNEDMLNSLFGSCLENGCTKSVELNPNETLFNMTTVDNYLSNASYTGDGVSTLSYLLNGTGSSSYTYGAIWNYSYTGYSSSDPANIYSRSRIRTTLTGDKSNIDEWLTDNSSANDYYGYDTLCDTSNCLFSCFPSNLQEAMVPRTTLNSGNATSGSYRNADTKTTYDKLFLFSLKEIGISSSYDDAGGVDYGVNPNSSDRIAYEFSGTGATASSSRSWWSRSRYSSYNNFAYGVTTSGGDVNFNVAYNYGLSPGFCLPGPEPETVNYAVKLWGIQVDTYSYNDGSDTYTAGLTFGPALGANHLNDYVSRETVIAGDGSHNSTYCIHDMSWDEIIAQSKADPTVFADCKANGCTKAVELNLNDTLGNQTTINNYLSQGYSGDGVSTLYYLLNYDSSPAYACRWNYSYTDYSSSDPANIYSKSRIRVTLNGDSSDAELKYASSGGESGGGSDLCNESNCLLSCFPSDLQNAIVPRTVQASSSSYDKTTYDKLWLPTISEIGNTYASDNGVDYGIASSASERVAYEFSGRSATTSSSLSWWSRSRNSSGSFSAYSVNTSGGYNDTLVRGAYGLSPGFCIE